MQKVIFIDNHDSFTYNLVEELNVLDYQVDVYRNSVDIAYLTKVIDGLLSKGIKPILFFSPGPGKPSHAPIMAKLLESYLGKLPILGVCLGHQAIAEYYGAQVDLAGETVHGKSSKLSFTQHPIFDGFTELTVARYHSLIVKNLPNQLQPIAELNDMTMAMINEENKVVSFQFHPESLLTINGSKLLQQTLNYITH